MSPIVNSAVEARAPLILHVEDSVDDARFVQRALDRLEADVEVEVVTDGRSAIARLLDPSRRLPQLVLLDLRLPLASGFDVLEAIRADARTQGLPVIVLSTSELARDHEAARRAPCFASSSMVKAVTMSQLQAELEAVVRYWLETAWQLR